MGVLGGLQVMITLWRYCRLLAAVATGEQGATVKDARWSQHEGMSSLAPLHSSSLVQVKTDFLASDHDLDQGCKLRREQGEERSWQLASQSRRIS